jgi:hypothetical protein
MDLNKPLFLVQQKTINHTKMKQKLFLVVLLVAGFFISAKAQDKSTGDQTITVQGRAALPSAISGDALLGKVYGLDANYSTNRNSMNLSKTFQGESVSSETEFEVPQDAQGLNLNLGGSCKSGEITIKIYLPGGEPYKSQKITSAADINWSTTMTFKDESEKKYKGTWKVKIQTNVCEGRYNLNISTR